MANPILDYPITYRGFTFNRHKDTAGADVRANLLDTMRLRRFDFSPASIREQIEGLHLDTGADLGVATREYRRVSLVGEIVGSTDALLADREASFLSALDIEEAQRTSPATEGVSALDFYCPTAAPPTGHTSPVHEMVLARPHGFPVTYEQVSRGRVKMAACEWVCPDPRRYLYAQTVVTPTGPGWAGVCPNWAVGMGVLVFPVISFTMAAGGGTLRYVGITDGTTHFSLDTVSITSGDVVVIDMTTGRITRNGTDRADLRRSAVDTLFGIAPGGSTITLFSTGDEEEVDEDPPPAVPGTFAAASITYRMARA